MSDSVIMWVGLFIFGMFFIYLIAEGIHIIVIKDTEKIKEVALGIIAIPANLLLLWLLIKIPFPEWLLEWMRNNTFLTEIIGGSICISIICFFIKRQEKRKK